MRDVGSNHNRPEGYGGHTPMYTSAGSTIPTLPASKDTAITNGSPDASVSGPWVPFAVRVTRGAGGPPSLSLVTKASFDPFALVS